MPDVIQFRDRIKEFRRVLAAELKPSPRNWRKHPAKQKAVLEGVLSEIGYADALLVRELPDGSLQLIDGHLRAETTPAQMVPVLILDVDEHEANKLLATLDPLAAMAEADAGQLDALLRDVQTGSEAVAGMLTELAAKADIIAGIEPAELPTLATGDKEPFQQMTFTLHDTQADIIKRAIDKAKADGCDSDVNENSNGNALAAIAEVYLGER